MDHDQNKWISKEPDRLPDFIIGGAMKSGTSTLHAILDRHPDVYIPKDEIGFLDCDNINEHFDFSFYDKGKRTWTSQQMDSDPEKMWDWYLSKFNGGEGKICGEDSTSYLASPTVAQRIAIQKKPIKIVFILRQPSRRTYSHYYHLLRAGIVSTTFEDTIQFNPHLVINRSLYLKQLKAYYDILPREQIKVILFEDLVTHPKEVVKEVCEFLSIDTSKFSEGDFSLHANKAKLPLFPWLQRFKNRHFRSYGNSFYLDSLPNKAPGRFRSRALFAKIVTRLFKLINPLVEKKPKAMRPETKAFLDSYFKTELEGLDTLIGQAAFQKWFQ